MKPHINLLWDLQMQKKLAIKQAFMVFCNFYDIPKVLITPPNRTEQTLASHFSKISPRICVALKNNSRISLSHAFFVVKRIIHHDMTVFLEWLQYPECIKKKKEVKKVYNVLPEFLQLIEGGSTLYVMRIVNVPHVNVPRPAALKVL